MPTARATGLVAGLCCTIAAVAPARAAAPAVPFDIPAQPLAGALDRFGRQAGVQILYPYRVAAARRSEALRGSLPPHAALDRLLRGSGLEVARFTSRLVILRVALPPPPVARRPTPPRPMAARPAPVTDAPPPEIVLTGRAAAGPLRETELSYAVTRIGADGLAAKGPLSTAELFRQIPGFWVEATGGEASNNVRSRGIPTDGYSSVALLEDGLPVQYDGGLGYLNTDQAFRLDATIDRVEAVRGGPSAVFMANAPGGTVNFITRNGLSRPGETLAATLGSFGYRRIDGFAGARVAPDLGLSLGGFWRVDNGLRDPGYTGDRGGQIRAGIDFDHGRLRLSFNVKRLDDRVILYLPVPLQLDAAGHVRGIPGFDPLFDTLAGPDTAHVTLPTPTGAQDFDLTQGTHSRITFYTGSARLALAPRTALEVKARLRTGTTIRNALFPVGRPMTAADYLAGVGSQLAAAFPNVAGSIIRYAGGGAPFPPDANGNGLVVGANLLAVRLPMTEATGDARLTTEFDRLGHHALAIGATYAGARLDFGRTMGTVLLDVSGQARRLDVIALDADGRTVGALTDRGFTRYGSLFDAVRLRTANVALYAADEWRLAPGWRVDLGARFERIRIGGGMEQQAAVDLGDPATLADDAVLAGTGVIAPIRRRFSGMSWTVAANYNPHPSTGLFVRLTRIARLPSATEFNAAPDRTDEAVVPITMAEAGLILRQPRWSVSAVAFDTRFRRLPFTDHRFDPATNGYVDTTAIAGTAARGLELDGHADLVGPLRLDLQATLQDPRYRNFRYVELVDGVGIARDATGNQLIRVPRLSLRATPSLDFGGGRLRLAAEFVHHSGRFADIANTQALPAFSLLNLTANARLGDHLSLAFNATNVTNALGLTEGNPRAGSFDAGGPGRYFLARPEFGRAVRLTMTFTR